MAQLNAGEDSVVGGLVGRLYPHHQGYFQSCFAATPMAVGPGSVTGGLIGRLEAESFFPQSYWGWLWDTSISGVTTTAGGGLGLPTERMVFPMGVESYWYFDLGGGVWTIDSRNLNSGYPYHSTLPAGAGVWTVSYDPGPGGSITGPASQRRISGAFTTAVTAVPAEGHRFVQWSDGRTDNPRVDRNVTADMTLTAIFAPITSQWILH
jgi:hypothetical protein